MGDLIGIALLILMSALFAMSEISIAASRKIKLRVMADEGNVHALAVLKLQEQPGAFFAMIQITLNAIAILGGIVGEQALSPYMQEILQLFYQGPLLGQISFVLSFLIITSLFILFADLLPKRLAMILPEAVAVRVVTIMRWVTFALTPLVLFFNGLTNIVLRVFKVPSEREDIVTTEDIVAMMDAGAEYGSLQQQEYDLIGNVFDLEARFLSSVMSPREQIVYFDIDEATYLNTVSKARPDVVGRSNEKLPVHIGLANEKGYPHGGALDFVGNQIDRNTGTVRVRAIIPNADGLLTPGAFARVQLGTGSEQKVILVNDQAVGTDQGNKYVLVVDANNKAQYRPIVLGPMVDGLRVISDGLKAGEKIIIKGLVRPGMAVTPDIVSMQTLLSVPERQPEGASKKSNGKNEGGSK